MRTTGWVKGVRAFAMTVALVALVVPVAFADSGTNHRVRQGRPIQLGTSGGNINDFLRGGAFCQSGTLGSLVQKADASQHISQHILSNNHVLARTNKASLGEDINQPGLIDVGCRRIDSDVVADLSAFVPLQFKTKSSTPLNKVDAAIALVRSGAVDTTGSILDIGTLSASIATAKVGCSVQKSGRTTGLTPGSVSAVDVDVDVNYGNGKVAHFIDQFLVRPGSFSAGGDSGSLIATVAGAGAKASAAGLLFAGSSDFTVANPIQAVQTSLGVSMVGDGTGTDCPEPAPASGGASASSASDVKRRHQDQLLQLPDVVGVGVGAGAAIEIYLARENVETRRRIPAKIEGVPVRVILSGEFHAR